MNPDIIKTQFYISTNIDDSILHPECICREICLLVTESK